MKGSKFAIKGWKVRGGSANGFTPSVSVNSMSSSLMSISPCYGGHSGDASDSSGGTNRTGTTGPKSLAELMSSKSGNVSTTTNSNKASIFERLGEVPIPAGGGGPGRPKSNIIPTPESQEPVSELEDHHAATPLIQNPLENTLVRCTSILCESHDKMIVDTIMRDVVQRDLNVSFEDIAALDDAKRLLNEAIVLPILMPEFFTGKLIILFSSIAFPQNTICPDRYKRTLERCSALRASWDRQDSPRKGSSWNQFQCLF